MASIVMLDYGRVRWSRMIPGQVFQDVYHISMVIAVGSRIIPWLSLVSWLIFPMENPPWLGNRLSEYVLFLGGPLQQIQVDTLQTMNNSELVNVDNPIPSSWLSGWVSSHPRIDLAISKWTIPSPPNVFSPIGWYQYPNTGWCPPVMCVAL